MALTQTTVQFAGADGTMLVGTLALATNQSPTSCVLMVHGGMGHRDYLYHKHITQEILAEHGGDVAVFRFDYNGNGDSDGDRFFMSSFHQDLDDIKVVISMLRAPPYQLQTVCIIGHSAGAQHALQFAVRSLREQEPDIVPPLMVCVQPRFRLQYWHEEWVRQTSQSGDGTWIMRWKTRGRQKEHSITLDDVKSYTSIDMDAIRNLNDPCFGDGRLQILTLHGVVATTKNSGANIMGYGAHDKATPDGVVPIVDCCAIANRINCDRHSMQLVSVTLISWHVETEVVTVSRCHRLLEWITISEKGVPRAGCGQF